MVTDHAQQTLTAIKQYYDAVDYPKYRNIDLPVFKKHYDELIGLKPILESNVIYNRLVNAISQVISRVEEQQSFLQEPTKNSWSNLSERGMNKVIPAIEKRNVVEFPVQWTDKWGNACSADKGYWTAKNYRVMDALGYMLLLKEGGDRLPEEHYPIFDDLMDIESRERQLNGIVTDLSTGINTSVLHHTVYSIGFDDSHFRKHTGLKVSSADILNLLLDTSRVEFKLCYPVRLKSIGNDDGYHHMNFYSRFFEVREHPKRIRKDGIVQLRRYRVFFNTLLGELFVNNLKARYNDWVDRKFYSLPDSAQLFYRRKMLNNSYNDKTFLLSTIAIAAGLYTSDEGNLIRTIERNILEPLKGFGYIHSYKRVNGHGGIKYEIIRKTPKSISQ
jgi:hypothetical protein